MIRITPLLIFGIMGIIYCWPFAFSKSPGGWAGLEALAIIIVWILPSFVINFFMNLFIKSRTRNTIAQVIVALVLLLYYLFYVAE